MRPPRHSLIEVNSRLVGCFCARAAGRRRFFGNFGAVLAGSAVMGADVLGSVVFSVLVVWRKFAFFEISTELSLGTVVL